MKKFLLILGCLGLSVLVSGCNNSKENSIVKICSDVNALILKYEKKEVDKNGIIQEIKPLQKQCSSDSNVCVALNSSLLNENSTDEVISASLIAIKDTCNREVKKF